MAIKQSTLEGKWFYRAAKIFFLMMPWLVAAGAVAQKKIDIGNAAIGLTAYFVILIGGFRIFLYIVFGGLEKELSTTTSNNHPAAPEIPPKRNDGQTGFFIALLIILGIIYYVIFAWKPSRRPSQFNNKDNRTTTSSPGPNQNTNTNTGKNTNKNSKCVPTGCGSWWYCSGAYYLDGTQVKVNGCLPQKAGEIYSGWSGTCRQCP